MAEDKLIAEFAALGGDEPTPAFVDALGERLDAELSGGTDGFGEIIDLGLVDLAATQREERSMRKIWIAGLGSVAAAALIVAVILAAAWGQGGDDSNSTDVVGVDDSTPQQSTTLPSTTLPSTTTSLAEATTTETVPEVEGPTRLVDEEVTVRAGMYRVDTLGTPFTFTLATTWAVQPNRDGRFVLSDPRATGPGQDDLVFLRATQLIDPTNPRAPADQRGEGWPVNDMTGWIEAVIPEIAVAETTEVTVSGFEAIRFDVTLSDDLECLTGSCIEFATNTKADAYFGPDISYRVWWISQGEFDPIVVVAAALRPDEFLPRVDELMAGLSIGEPLPNPVLGD